MLWLLIGLGWASSQIDNYHYYLKRNAHSDATRLGVRFWKWEGTPEGEIDSGYGYPAAILFQFNHQGQELIPLPFWIYGDITYVVLEGEIDFGENEFVSTPVPRNETVWVRAGSPMQKIVSTTDNALLIAIGAEFEINVSNFPNLNASEALKELTTHPGFHYKLEDAVVMPNPTNPANLNNTIWRNHHEVDGIPPLQMVTFMPYSLLPSHYHPTSALYVLQQGEFHFPGEGIRMEVGEMRWVAPGHFYNGEGSLNKWANTFVLGVDTHPMFQDDPPDMPYVMAHQHQTHMIFSKVNVEQLTVEDL